MMLLWRGTTAYAFMMEKYRESVLASEEPCSLCCCQRLHEPVDMPCCCDCEAVDNFCDRCCRCQSITDADVDRLFNSMQDRCRFPSFSGRGAIQIRLDLVVPLIMIPLGLFLSSNGSYFMYFVFPLYALTLLGYYRLWKRRTKRTKSRFFFSWAVTSCLTLYYVFQIVITVYREVLFWENLLFSTMFALTMYCLYLTRCDPGIVQTIKAKPNSHRRIGSHGKLTNAELIASKGPSIPNSAATYSWNENPPEHGSVHENGIKGFAKTANFSSIQINSDVPVVWCDSCQSEVPAYSAHCPVCDVCVLGRDHHCVWVDNCIGVNNHRAFFLGMVLMLLTGLYGSQLMLTTVCTPEMYYDWFLVPADCTLVYSSHLSGLGYVSAIYALCSITLLSLLVIYQAMLISQNITSQQLYEAHHAGRVRFGIFVSNNQNSRGLYKNWKAFLFGRKRRTSNLIVTWYVHRCASHSWKYC